MLTSPPGAVEQRKLDDERVTKRPWFAGDNDGLSNAALHADLPCRKPHRSPVTDGVQLQSPTMRERSAMSKNALSALYALTLSLGILANGSVTADQFVRLSLQEFVKDPSRLESLFKGIQVMKSRNDEPRDSAAYRTSWEYWAAIHGYLGPDSTHGTIEDNKQDRLKRIEKAAKNPAAPDLEVAKAVSAYFDGMNDLSAPDELAKKIWNTCQHGTQFFFPWHRAYLYYFERVLREASGDLLLCCRIGTTQTTKSIKKKRKNHHGEFQLYSHCD